MVFNPRVLSKVMLVVSLVWFVPGKAEAYGVLTHQAIIDVSWEKSLVPVLKRKFPKATEEELREAHAHAYGGAIIQDMGYYPFGNVFFTDLTHYVRSGDFINALLSEAQNLNEYAFGLGALAHYYADNYGHPIGTNRAVPMMYPETKAQHGNSVSYEEDPVAHIKMEFGFDVLQVARGNYASQQYRDFIGFEVSTESLERAFKKTYGLELKSLFVNLGLTVGSFRYSVSTLFPNLTKAAWNLKSDDIRKAIPSATKQKFIYRIKKTEYHKQFGREYQKPNFFQRVLSWILGILPKFGPNKALAFKPPSPQAEKVFMESFNVTIEKYALGLTTLSKDSITLKNTALDTGDATKNGTYKKADETYAELLKRLVKEQPSEVPAQLRRNILSFYNGAKAPKMEDKEDAKDWEKTLENLEKFKAGK
ncbi:zinc dependent phospholipase C family protein [Rufibacter sp. LB8]|nr:zinc dependent phospholipase C family protein [Rufibacter sp. LB8]